MTFRRVSVGLRDRCIGSIGPYIARCLQVDYSTLDFEDKVVSLQKFWINHRLDYSAWFEFATICFLHQPSSCAAERVFSILKYILTYSNHLALDDYIKAAVYSRYDNK